MMTNLQSSAFVAKTTQLLSSVARLRLLLVMLLTLCSSANMWGADVTFDLTKASYNSSSQTEVVWTSTPVTMKIEKGSSSTNANNYLGGTNSNTRCYSGQVFSVSVSSGYELKTIVITSTGSSYIMPTSGWSNATATSNGSVVTVTANSGATVISVNPGGTKRLTKVEITYESSTPAVPCTVTFSAGSNGTCSTTSLTETSAGAGVTLPDVTPNSGYRFLGWATTNSATTANAGTAGETYKPASNITLYAVYKQQCTITWLVDGNAAEGSPTTKVDKGGKVTTLPTTPTLDCSGKTFVGWSNQEVTDGNKPSVLFTTAANSPAINENTTFHAVFAKETTTTGGTTTTTFTAGTDNIATGKNGIKFTMSNTTGSGGYYQVYSGSAMTINSDNPITSFIITCTASGTSKYGPGNITFKTGLYSYSGTTGTWTGNSKSIESNNSTAQLRITKIVVTTSGGTTTTYSDYTTSCSTETTVSVLPKIMNFWQSIFGVSLGYLRDKTGYRHVLGGIVVVSLHHKCTKIDFHHINMSKTASSNCAFSCGKQPSVFSL